MTKKTRDIEEFKKEAQSIMEALEEVKLENRKEKVKMAKKIMPIWRKFSELKKTYNNLSKSDEYHQYCKKIKDEFKNFEKEVPFLKKALRTKSDF